MIKQTATQPIEVPVYVTKAFKGDKQAAPSLEPNIHKMLSRRAIGEAPTADIL